MAVAGTVERTSVTLRDSVQAVGRRAAGIQKRAEDKNNEGVKLVCRQISIRLQPIPAIVTEVAEAENEIDIWNAHKERTVGNEKEQKETDEKIAKLRRKIDEGKNKVETALKQVSPLLDGAEKKL